MTEINTLRPLWALVNNQGCRLRDPYTSVCLPVFDYPIQAFDYADSKGISRGVYDIVNIGKKVK